MYLSIPRMIIYLHKAIAPLISSLSSKTTQKAAPIYTNKQDFTLHIDPMFQYFFITLLYMLLGV